MGALFSGPPSAAAPNIMIQNTPPPDPDLASQRDLLRDRADQKAAAASQRSIDSIVGRSMGTRGSRSLFTGTAAGYTRTLGSASV